MTDYDILLKHYNKAKQSLEQMENRNDLENDIYSIIHFRGKVQALKRIIDEIKEGVIE